MRHPSPGSVPAQRALSVGDGVMLLAGIYGFAVHDGERWEVIADLLMLERQWETQNDGAMNKTLENE